MKTIIEMAREAAGDDWGLFQEYMPEIHRLAELVRADEREACAKTAEDMNAAVLAILNVTSQPRAIAAAIRNRSKP